MSKTYEEIYDITSDYFGFKHRSWAKTEIDGYEWWLVFEYLDWKYNNCIFTDLAFSRKVDDWNRELAQSSPLN